MEGSSWPKSEPIIMDGSAAGDWRSQLQPEARQRIVNKIMETLKKHLPVTVPEGLNELQKIAVRFEDKIYTAAKDQQDYLRRISMKMLSMDTKSQNSTGINPSLSNSAAVNQNTADSASSLGVQTQISQGQLTTPFSQSPVRQPVLSQSIQNNVSAALQGSAGMQPTLASISGLTQSTISNVGINQTSSLQSMPGISQNTAAHSSGQGSAPNLYVNSQRQLQSRQQQPTLISQQQPTVMSQHQSQNPLMYQAYQKQLYKQKLQQLQPQLQQQPSMQSGQVTVQQTQPTIKAPQAGLQQQSQQNLIQQTVPSLMQQHPQSIAREQQAQSGIHQQPSSLQQHSAAISQQPLLASQQQQLMSQLPNVVNTQTSQQLVQQNNNTSDMQQQQQPRLSQQNNHLGMQQSQQMLNKKNVSLHQQQQLGSQNITGLQQQQQLLGTQPNLSNTHSLGSINILQQAKSNQLQQHLQSANMLQTQGQSQHPQSQQLMPQVQSQPAQLQQQMAMQQSNALQRKMQNRFQTSGGFQSQNAFEQQKQYIHSQRLIPEVSSSTSLDSTAQTGQSGIAEWQEEVYQKIKSLKDTYLPDLLDLSQKLALKIQQREAQGPTVKQTDQHKKMEVYRTAVDHLIQFLQISKNNIQPSIKDKFENYEKQIIHFATNGGRKFAQQQQFQQQGGHNLSMTQQQPSQVSQMQHEIHANQVQLMNLQGPGASVQPATTSMQHGSGPVPQLGISTSQQNITNMIQPGSNLDSQGNSFASQGLAQHNMMGTFNTMNASQHSNINRLPQSSASTMQPSVMQPSSNIFKQANVKQEQQQQQLLQNQQMKQMQQRHIQQQMMQQQQKQLLLQQQPAMQQQLLQQKQQATNLPIHQMAQLNQMNDSNEIKLRQVSAMKSGLYQQHYSAGQRNNCYNNQPLKPGSLPISSPQNLQTASPQISQHSSPQVDQHGLLPSHTKVGTPLQTSNSPVVIPSPSSPITPSSAPGDAEKKNSVIPIASAATMSHQQSNLAPQNQSLSVGTPGISASPLLAECTGLDGNHANVSTVMDPPLDRLVKAVQCISAKALDSTVRDIGAVVSMMDRFAGSAPGNGSRAAVGEDLVAMTKCRLQARNFISQDANATAKKMKRHTSAIPLDSVLSAGSMNDSFKQLCDLDSSELESSATSRIKRQKIQVNRTLLQEIKEINQQLIETILSISYEDDDSVAAAAEGGDGTVIQFAFSAVAFSSSLQSQFASLKVSPITPLTVFVPANYPECSPVLLDKLPLDVSPENEDLSLKAMTQFSISLRGLSQPMSLGDMAKTWDVCAHKVIAEYAQQMGGGSFCSRYGAWESCVSA